MTSWPSTFPPKAFKTANFRNRDKNAAQTTYAHTHSHTHTHTPNPMSKEYVLWCYLLEFASLRFLQPLIVLFSFSFLRAWSVSFYSFLKTNVERRVSLISVRRIKCVNITWLDIIFSLCFFLVCSFDIAAASLFSSFLFSLPCHDVFGWYILLYAHDKSLSIFKNIVQDLFVLVFIFRRSIYAFRQYFSVYAVGTHRTAITIIVTTKESEWRKFAVEILPRCVLLRLLHNLSNSHYVHGCVRMRRVLDFEITAQHAPIFWTQTSVAIANNNTRTHTRWEGGKPHQQQ